MYPVLFLYLLFSNRRALVDDGVLQFLALLVNREERWVALRLQNEASERENSTKQRTLNRWIKHENRKIVEHKSIADDWRRRKLKGFTFALKSRRRRLDRRSERSWKLQLPPQTPFRKIHFHKLFSFYYIGKKNLMLDLFTYVGMHGLNSGAETHPPKNYTPVSFWVVTI